MKHKATGHSTAAVWKQLFEKHEEAVASLPEAEQMAEADQLFDQMKNEAVEIMDKPSADISHVYVFSDRSGLVMVRAVCSGCGEETFGWAAFDHVTKDSQFDVKSTCNLECAA